MKSNTASVIPMQQQPSESEARKTIPHSRTPSDLSRDPSITFQAKSLYTLLGTYTNAKGWCYPSVATLAEHMNVRRKWIQKYLSELESAGYIEIHRSKGGGSKYRLFDERVSTPNLSLVRDNSHVSTCPSEGTTPVPLKGQPCPSEGTTPVPSRTPDQVVLTNTKEQGVRTMAALAENTGEPEAPDTLPRGVVLGENGNPMLTPITTDTEGRAVFDSGAVLYVAKHVLEITTDTYDLPLRAWIETHGNTMPRIHDAKRITQLTKTHGAASLTSVIRRNGDSGLLAMKHIVEYYEKGGK